MRYQILIYEAPLYGKKKIFNPKELINANGSVIMASDFDCLVEKHFSNDELKLFGIEQIIEFSDTFNYQVVEASIVAETIKKLKNLNLYLIEYQTTERKINPEKTLTEKVKYQYCLIKYKIEDDTDQFGFLPEAIEELPKIETYLTSEYTILREFAKHIVKTRGIAQK